MSASINVPRPELLAPAGDRQCLRAAVENGADAVYFGLEIGFNARVRATNIALDEIDEVMTYLHQRGVRGYVTFNTLIFTEELAAAEKTVRRLAAGGVDALLIQDLGLARFVREIEPDLAIHASTQMTLTSAECIRVAEELGVSRVVLARELSVREIAKIHSQTSMALEVFVHGALCVAYSGQCLTSESLGGRSANRGQCAQACRLPYDVICDGEDVELGDVKYLLSPQDLAAFELIPQLIDAGVCSLKIEGRLKTPEYVANITKHYREAIDQAMTRQKVELSRRDVMEMELSFSRGFSPGWLQGCDHKMLVPGLSSAKRGVRLGQVVSVNRSGVIVRLDAPIARGDGVVFAGDRERDQEQGGRVYQVYRQGELLEQSVDEGEVELAFDRQGVDLTQLYAGQAVWKTDDPKLNARLRKTFQNRDPLRRVPLDVEVDAAVGQSLRISARAESGATCRLESESPLAEAIKHPLDQATLEQQLGRLGASVYQLRKLTARIEGRPMVPLSVLGQLRRQLIEDLDRSLEVPAQRSPAGRKSLLELRGEVIEQATDLPARDTNNSQLRVLCRTLPQLSEVLACGVKSVLVDFQDIREYREAVRTAHDRGAEIFLATPRIQKPDERGIFLALAKHGADGMLVRNLAGLRFFTERKTAVDADFSLNAANELTAGFLHEQGARRITASYDLNRDQLFDLVATVPAPWLEVVVHQHMPMFHMEHCVFCAVLSPGTNKTNCGRPCDVHRVELRDRVGMEHPLLADVGCRNTLFNAVPQSAAEAVRELLQRGVRHFRIELLTDSGSNLVQTIELYRDLLAGRVRAKEVWQRLNASNRVGVTRGTLEERRNPLAIL